MAREQPRHFPGGLEMPLGICANRRPAASRLVCSRMQVDDIGKGAAIRVMEVHVIDGYQV